MCAKQLRPALPILSIQVIEYHLQVDGGFWKTTEKWPQNDLIPPSELFRPIIHDYTHYNVLPHNIENYCIYTVSQDKLHKQLVSELRQMPIIINNF